MGLVLKVKVHAADISDQAGAKVLLSSLGFEVFPRLKKIWADEGYRGELIGWVKGRFGWMLELVKKPRDCGFHVLPRRWVVERTFAWLGRNRRLSKEYEYLGESSEAFIYAAMIRLMSKRLAREGAR